MKRIFSLILIIILAFSAFSAAISVSAADTSELEELIREAERKLSESSNYTSVSIAMLQAAYDDACSVVDRVELDMADQSDVDQAAATLRERIDNLIPASGGSSLSGADKSKLQAAITKAETFQRSDYDVNSMEWSTFQSKITTAESAAANETYTQAQIDNFTAVLENAIEDMEGKKKFSTGTEATQSTSAATESTSVTEATAQRETTPPTEKVTKVYPKMTEPLSEGGFVYLGCDASIALSTLAVVGIIGAAVAIKKKED